MDMDSDDDNTAILNMKHCMQSMLSHGKHQGTGLAHRLSFNSSQLGDTTRKEEKRSTVQQILRKESEDHRQKVELIEAKRHIAELETKMTSLDQSRKRARVDYEKDIDGLKSVSHRDQEKITELKHQLHQMLEKEERWKEELSSSRSNFSMTKKRLEQSIHKLQKEKLEIETTLQESEENSRKKLNALRSETLRQQTELQIRQTELDETREQLQLSNKKYVDTKRQLSEMEETKLENINLVQKVKDLELKILKMDETSTYANSMKSKINKVGDLEKENKKLKETNDRYRDVEENVALLREQILSYKRKEDKAEKAMMRLAQLEVDYQALQEKAAKWETTDASGVARPQSPSQLHRKIHELQNTNEVLLGKQGELQASLHVYEQQASTSGHKATSLRDQLASEQTRSQQLRNSLKRIQTKLVLLSKERDAYKTIIESYESEVTVNIDSAASHRIKQLEDLVEGYRKQCASVEADLEDAIERRTALETRVQSLEIQLSSHKTTLPFPGVTSEADQNIITDLRNQVAELEKRMEEVTRERDILEERIERRNLQGDYDPTKTKVLHFSLNPHALAQDSKRTQIDKLQEENKQLRKRMEIMEEAGGRVEDMTMRVGATLDEPVNPKQVEELQAKVQEAKLKNTRLMEAFQKTSKEFREVCYQLLGYRIDMSKTNQYKLLSMYADSPEDYFLFQQTRDGEIQMLETPFSATRTEQIETYLQNASSIPAFLSNNTLHLFSQQTMMQ